MNARCLLYADVCQPLAEVFHATDNANIRCRAGRSQAKARAFHFYFIPIQLTPNEAVSRHRVLVQPQRCVRMVEIQGAEAEAEGGVLAYTTKAECR